MRKLILILIIFFCFCVIQLPAAQQINVRSAVEKQEVFTNEFFVYQIIINGSDKSQTPQLSGFDDFDVTFTNEGANNSQSITIINGRRTEEVRYGYIYQYQLSAKRVGIITIPAVQVVVDGKTYTTQPVRITVKEPAEVSEYKLRLFASKDTCYVGEPIMVSLIFYLAEPSIENASFNYPLLLDDRFTNSDPDTPKNTHYKYYAFILNNQQVEMEYNPTQSKLGDKDYNTLTFNRIIVPKTPGTITISNATVQFTGVSGYQNVRDWFGNTARQPMYTNMVVPSNTLLFTVKAVPETGQPNNYSGLIGQFTVEASASPVDVKVGDPITLQITLTGSRFLKEAQIPAFNTYYPLNDFFKIPADISPGKTESDRKVFVQTIRPAGVEVNKIPVIEIPYFNPVSGRYEYARSKEIPIKVGANDIKTFKDLKGINTDEMKSELEAWQEGISHNYEGADLLKDQSPVLNTLFRNPWFIAFLVVPVIIFLALLYFTKFSHLIRTSDEDIKSKKAYTLLMKTINDVSNNSQAHDTVNIFGKLIDALNSYIGAKLKLTSTKSLTFNDIQEPLLRHNIEPELLSRLKDIYKTCEAGHYGGTVTPDKVSVLCSLIKETISALERSFK